MTFLGELRITALHENLRTISHFINGLAERLRLTEKVVFELELAVEEAATNIIDHAYHNIPPGDILLRADEIDETIQITLTDWGIPLDPDQVKPFDIDAPIENRIRGGMGLHFIHTLMDRVERDIASATGEPSQLRLTKRMEHIPLGIFPHNPLQELNAMRTVSEYMTTNIDLDDLLKLILNKLVNTINAERGTIFLIDEEKQELWSRALQQDDGPVTEIRIKLSEGIAGHVATTGETLNIPDAYADPRFSRAVDQATGYRTRSLLTVPMLNPQQKTIGVVQVLNKVDGPFTTRDERLLVALAAQASVSLENARLYQQEIEQQVIQRELETAHSIQASFLPETIPQPNGWEIAAMWKPIQNVAGDFYDVYALDRGRLAIVIADVSGKGIPAALFMSLTVTVLRFGMSVGLRPGEVMRRANELIIADQRSRMFATAFLCYLDPKTGRMRVASAGHNPPILYRAAEGTCEYIQTTGVAVGIFPNATFEEITVHMEPGDALVLYTDGISEVIDEDDQEFGEDRIETLLIQHLDQSAKDIGNTILRAVVEFAGDKGLFDDATLVVIKRYPHAPYADVDR